MSDKHWVQKADEEYRKLQGRKATTELGKYQNEPDWTRYFWEQIVLNGFGEDRELNGVTFTFVSLTDEERALFPEVIKKYLKLWEDDNGFVRSEQVDEIPEPSDEDLGFPAEEGGVRP